MKTYQYIGKDETYCYFEICTGDIFGFPVEDCQPEITEAISNEEK